ncbi:hypothetical protein GH714_014171 [Hevea brasiliensis]|uniref:non-specific serine/threonine protein kinase n=1 Tax=Hevea brasiliensis TaxID=3981 RepID=A0A6A6KK17_HEVBR|nr:hypothetical protein GH714_014171 [Hevea brasiliensis]
MIQLSTGVDVAIFAADVRDFDSIQKVVAEQALLCFGGESSKFGLRGLAEALQQEVIADDIHVSLIFPPDTETPGLAEVELVWKYRKVARTKEIASIQYHPHVAFVPAAAAFDNVMEIWTLIKFTRDSTVATIITGVASWIVTGGGQVLLTKDITEQSKRPIKFHMEEDTKLQYSQLNKFSWQELQVSTNGFSNENILDQGPSQPLLDWPIRRQIALGSAKGLSYLHEHCNPRIIHCDVKAANIFLDDNFEAFVGDFAVKRFVKENKLEVLVDPNLGNNYVGAEIEQLMQIALLCTHGLPEYRPKMSEVVRMVESVGLAERNTNQNSSQARYTTQVDSRNVATKEFISDSPLDESASIDLSKLGTE